MIEQLRIQCPSCGIILDVRNSKHEAVKRITCPHCKKQLAVDFREEIVPQASSKPLGSLFYGEMRIDLKEGVNQIPLPASDTLEITLVRLNDGNYKCLVRALNEEQSVWVNGLPLSKEEEVALAVGDELRIGNSVLAYGQPMKTVNIQKPPAEEPMKEVVPKDANPHLTQWVIAGIALMFALLLVWQLWPSKDNRNAFPVVKMGIADSTKKDSAQTKTNLTPPSPQVKEKEVREKDVTIEKPSEPTSEYDLVKLANNGDANAQYELGKRYVKREGRNNIILGINYLREASINGSSDARTTLNKVINTLQHQADHGDSIAYQVLMSIDHQ